MKFNKEQLNPLTKKWEKTGTAIITDEEVEILNASSNFSKVRYVPADEFDIEKATLDELKAYAESKGIDLGNATKKADVKTAILNSIEVEEEEV